MRKFVAASILAAILSTPAAAYQEQATDPVFVTFEENGDQIDDMAKEPLALMAHDSSGLRFKVTGYATPAEAERNSREYAVALSQRRALRIREFLVHEGVPAGSFTTEAGIGRMRRSSSV